MTDERSGRGSRKRELSEQELERSTPVATGGREVRIGIFVLAGALAVLLALFLLTDPATFRGRYTVLTEVRDAGGVRSGDPVQMRGVNIGRVRRFALVEDGVRISLEINGQWAIPVDSRARVAGMGLLGGRTIEIIPGDADQTLDDGDLIPGEATEGLMDLAETLGTDAEDIVGRLQRLLADPTLAAVEGTAAETERLVGDLSALVEAQRTELQGLTSSLRRTAEEVEGSLTGPELARALARADSTLGHLNDAGLRLQTASASLEEVLGRMERGEGTLGLLSQDEALYRNLNRAAESMLFLAEDIRENPGRYVRLRIF
ncbi:MAG: MCE family protein [Gemmatimonadales bacterium]|nr:MAG: MCE family protein [Gemmatimonadales bacterium]